MSHPQPALRRDHFLLQHRAEQRFGVQLPFVAAVVGDGGQHDTDLLLAHPSGQHDVTTSHLNDRLQLDHSSIVVTNATYHFGRFTYRTGR